MKLWMDRNFAEDDVELHSPSGKIWTRAKLFGALACPSPTMSGSSEWSYRPVGMVGMVCECGVSCSAEALEASKSIFLHENGHKYTFLSHRCFPGRDHIRRRIGRLPMPCPLLARPAYRYLVI